MSIHGGILLTDLSRMAHEAAPQLGARVAYDPKVISDFEFFEKHGMSREAYRDSLSDKRLRNSALPTLTATLKPYRPRPTPHGTSSRPSALSSTASGPRSRTCSPVALNSRNS